MGPAPISGLLSPEGKKRPVEEVGEGQGLRFHVTFVFLSLTPYSRGDCWEHSLNWRPEVKVGVGACDLHSVTSHPTSAIVPCYTTDSPIPFYCKAFFQVASVKEPVTGSRLLFGLWVGEMGLDSQV